MTPRHARASLVASLWLLACGPSQPPASPAPARPATASEAPADEREVLEAQIKLARTIATGLMIGAALYRDSNNRCPSADDVVKAGLVSPALTARDIWGSPYRIHCSEDAITVISDGPDLTASTADDVMVSSK